VRRGPLSRRAFLRGAGGALIGLPMLQAMAPRRARAAALPSRFIVVYSPNGHPKSYFQAPAGSADPLASPILRPLDELRDRTLVLEGIGLRSAERLGHECIGSLLTGMRPGAGPSLDQEMAQVLGTTRLGSLELGVSIPAAPAGRVHLSFTGRDRPRPATNDPRLVFDRIFPTPNADGMAVAARVIRRRSVLDGVKSNLGQLLPQVSSADRATLQQHMDAVRELELGLDRVVPQACQPGMRPPPIELTLHQAADQLSRMQVELLRLAMVCDATRVATLMLGEAGSPRAFPFLGLRTDDPRDNWVNLSHRTDEASRNQHSLISTWCAERVRDLARGLQSTPEAEAGWTALDRTMILWMTECNPDHTTDDVPMVLVGGNKFMAFRPGRVARYQTGTSHNHLLLALLLLMGGRQASFGNAAYCKEPLSLL
jgi:hypothetical protein